MNFCMLHNRRLLAIIPACRPQNYAYFMEKVVFELAYSEHIKQM